MKKSTFLAIIALILLNQTFGQNKKAHSELIIENYNLDEPVVVTMNKVYSEDESLTGQLNEVEETLEDCGCPPPTENDFRGVCGDIASRAKAPESERRFYEFHYEKRLWMLSCADPSKDSWEEAILKIQCMWRKYHFNFQCDSLNVHIPNGNILKFSLSEAFPDVLETFVGVYGLDINYVDPRDNMNVLDFVNAHIARLKKQTNSTSAVNLYESYKKSLIGLGAKPSKL